jgi:hypothetical protein
MNGAGAMMSTLVPNSRSCPAIQTVIGVVLCANVSAARRPPTHGHLDVANVGDRAYATGLRSPEALADPSLARTTSLRMTSNFARPRHGMIVSTGVP